MSPGLIIAILLAFVLSLGLNWLMMRLAPHLGLMDEPGERRIHQAAVARAGGIAIWLSFLFILGGGLVSGWLKVGGALSWPWFRAFVASSAVLMIAGFLDDRKGLSPWVKLGAHFLAPSIFFLMHPMHLGLFPHGWPLAYDGLAFVIWCVILINAFNLIDGLDGLCGGLATVSILGMAGLAIANKQNEAALMLLIMGGSILGFLNYNINPARIFLGDAGSMLIGFFLATAATEAVGRKAVVGMVLLPIAVAGVPLLDVLLAIWRRGMRRLLLLLRGEKIVGGIFSADSEHLHHRLLHQTGSQRKVAITMQCISVVLTILAFLPMLLGSRVYVGSVVGFFVVALVGLRDLARVELENTGSVIHMAIKRPGRRRWVAAVLFFYDLLVLTGGSIAAVLIETNWLTLHYKVEPMIRFVMLFVVPGVVALFAMKIHQRLWVRATIRDIMSLHFWLLAASLVTFTLFSLQYKGMEWISLRLSLLSYLFAIGGVGLPRVALDVIRDFGTEARHRWSAGADDGGYGSVVVLGAGDMGTLLLLHFKSSDQGAYPGLKMIGFIDEQKSLHGRRLRSWKVLGGLQLIPSLVAKRGLKGIILAIDEPSEDLLERLAAIADEHQLRVYRWRAELEPTLGQADARQDCQGPDVAMRSAGNGCELSASGLEVRATA